MGGPSGQLVGTIPTSVTRLVYGSSLRIFDVGHGGSQMELSGPVPSYATVTFPPLEIMDLSGNRFSGTIPSAVGERLTELRELVLYDNRLERPIPTSVLRLSHLRVLRLDRNRFDGSLPSFAQLSQLETLHLHRNAFAGSYVSGSSTRCRICASCTRREMRSPGRTVIFDVTLDERVPESERALKHSSNRAITHLSVWTSRISATR